MVRVGDRVSVRVSSRAVLSTVDLPLILLISELELSMRKLVRES